MPQAAQDDQELARLEIPLDDFVRRFTQRGVALAWLLGAGASAAAGVPTAGDLIWRFKQQLFVTQRGASAQSVSDLGSDAVRDRLQAHIDSLGDLPAPGDDDEYAALFELTYPSEADRRGFIDQAFADARPSYGHIALASLMRADHARLVFTTNFDTLVADACAKVYGDTRLVMASLDAPEIGEQALPEDRFPLEVKLHGDFRSRRLKNTPDELRAQDARMRQLLVDASRRFGLVVCGYSGRDESVMDTLSSAITSGAFPGGLFWLARDGAVAPAVVELLEQARAKGVDAALVRVQNFDEVMRDILRALPDAESEPLREFAGTRERWAPAPRPQGRRGWPVIRLNALAVEEMPSVCRKVVCEIGGVSEVRQALADAGVDVPVTRSAPGVLAFGGDAEIRAAFEPFGIAEFDLHTIEQRRLRYDSAERGLLRDALTRALRQARALDHVRRRSADLLAPTDTSESAWQPLRTLAGAITGVLGSSGIRWREGVATRLDWADDRLWLLVEPRLVFDGLTDENRHLATDFTRERSIKRYNRQLNGLIEFWAALLRGSGEQLRTTGVSDGVDATFRLSGETGFSRRAGA